MRAWNRSANSGELRAGAGTEPHADQVTRGRPDGSTTTSADRRRSSGDEEAIDGAAELLGGLQRRGRVGELRHLGVEVAAAAADQAIEARLADAEPHAHAEQERAATTSTSGRRRPPA